MRCGNPDCRTPLDDVREVKGLVLCQPHRLMLWGATKPTSRMACLSPEERRKAFAERFKRLRRPGDRG